jgi:ABC-type transport system involved in multi-copper enzyme maturation permease subunit
MIFLPIVVRELRVAARRKTTFTVRSIVALLGIVISGFLLFMLEFVGQSGAKGQAVFLTVSWYTLLIALLGGIFLASDCLSEERREGTLGFLFLTDLKGYDIVLGKFAAVSLNAFYGMLAIFPVFALSILAGGVTPGEFWRTCLALVNALFFSIALAMLVSALGKSSSRSLPVAVCVLVAVLVLAFVATRLSSLAGKFGAPLFFLGALSPIASVQLASAANYLYRARAFWSSLAICHGAAWVCLGLASWRLAFFREKGERDAQSRRIFSHDTLAGQRERRSELLDTSPVLWLLDDSRRSRWIAWGLAVLGGTTLLLTSRMGSGFGGFMDTYVAWPFYFLIKVFFAIQACRFFSEARRTGALELLCCTPMKMPAIISGQWMALRRFFLWPVIILMACQLAGLAIAGPYTFPATAATTVVTTNGIAAKTSVAMPPPGLSIIEWYPMFLIIKQIANSVADFFAIGWFGMWLAFSLQKPATATGWTILYVIILPAILFCVPTLATDAIFIVVGYSKLQQDFRVSPAPT